LAHILRYTDPDQALNLLEQISDEDVDAELLMANLYVHRDKEKALHYFQRVIDLDVQPQTPRALLNMVTHHMCGYLEFDKQKAFQLIVQASEKSDPATTAAGCRIWERLSDFHHRGYGTAVNLYKATEALVRVPENLLNRDGKYNLGVWTYRGAGCIKPDFAKALDIMFELDSKYGDADAQTIIGDSFQKGKNPEGTPNVNLAVQWYRKAAKQGQVEAIKRLIDLAETVEEKVQWLKQLLHERKLHRKDFDNELENRNQTLTVDYDVLALIMDEMQGIQKQLESLQLRPPLIGGELFLKAEKMYAKHAAENDALRK
jgi:hypothetical protein